MKAVYPMEFDTPHRGLQWLEYYGQHKVYHPGWDLNRGVGNQDLGDDVFAPVNGEVEYISPEPTRWNYHNGGFGRFIILYHSAYGVWTRYAHLQKVLVKKGDKVEVGDKIGSVGNSGTKYVHLHFEVWKAETYKIQQNHHRKFAYYPSGKTKAWVNDHYVDGLKWIDDLNQKPGWQDEVEEWAGKYLKDVPGFLADPSPHKILVLIKNVLEKNN